MDPDLLASLDPPEDAEQSLVTFLAKGLSDDDLDDFAIHVMFKDPDNLWLYFCGCCWQGIKRGWRPPKPAEGELTVDKHGLCSNCDEGWRYCECPDASGFYR
jgi:hypothetical protein